MSFQDSKIHFTFWVLCRRHNSCVFQYVGAMFSLIISAWRCTEKWRYGRKWPLLCWLTEVAKMIVKKKPGDRSSRNIPIVNVFACWYDVMSVVKSEASLTWTTASRAIGPCHLARAVYREWAVTDSNHGRTTHICRKGFCHVSWTLTVNTCNV